jgi:hypothetical protein
MIGGLWEVSTKSEKVGPNDPQNPKKWVTKIVSGQSALFTAIVTPDGRWHQPHNANTATTPLAANMTSPRINSKQHHGSILE